jgi:hypothetical protein
MLPALCLTEPWQKDTERDPVSEKVERRRMLYLANRKQICLLGLVVASSYLIRSQDQIILF